MIFLKFLLVDTWNFVDVTLSRCKINTKHMYLENIVFF